jgi:hypothetical protein
MLYDNFDVSVLAKVKTCNDFSEFSSIVNCYLLLWQLTCNFLMFKRLKRLLVDFFDWLVGD